MEKVVLEYTTKNTRINIMEQNKSIDVVESDEKWSSYRLSNGDIIKFKPTLVNVELKKTDEDGNRMYEIKVQATTFIEQEESYDKQY